MCATQMPAGAPSWSDRSRSNTKLSQKHLPTHTPGPVGIPSPLIELCFIPGGPPRPLGFWLVCVLSASYTMQTQCEPNYLSFHHSQSSGDLRGHQGEWSHPAVPSFLPFYWLLHPTPPPISAPDLPPEPPLGIQLLFIFFLWLVFPSLDALVPCASKA